jgi:undecaprenyl-phosphate galactose phosphotransferase
MQFHDLFAHIQRDLPVIHLLETISPRPVTTAWLARHAPAPGRGIPHALGRSIKLGLDVVIAALALLLLSPLLLAIALYVRSDGGPALFAHKRIGRDGECFWCLKFRTMVTDAEQRLKQILATNATAAAEWAETQKLIADPRITRIGALLRKTSLDELPQLLNVMHGDMSLVGPRPIVEAEVVRYADDIGYYRAVRPGVTGLWQVSGRSDTSYAQRVRLDVDYVRNWSLRRDLMILLRTIPAVLSRRGAV